MNNFCLKAVFDIIGIFAAFSPKVNPLSHCSTLACFCRKINSEQFLFAEFFDIIGIFCSPKVNYFPIQEYYNISKTANFGAP